MGPFGGWSQFDRWSIALAFIASYFAVMTIVRLMAKRRDQNVADLERQMTTLRKQPKNKRPTKGRDAA